jgi:DinB superfamily
VPVPELELYRQQFAQISQQAKELTAGLNEARFNWRPSPAAWSIEECLSHLTMVGQWEILAIEKAIEKGRERGTKGNGPFQYGAIDRFIVDQTEPPVRNPLPAADRFVPLHGQPVTAVLPTFLHVQDQLTLQLERAEGLDLRRVKVATPITKLLKLSLGMMFAQIAAHERRHLAQATKVHQKLPQG